MTTSSKRIFLPIIGLCIVFIIAFFVLFSVRMRPRGEGDVVIGELVSVEGRMLKVVTTEEKTVTIETPDEVTVRRSFNQNGRIVEADATFDDLEIGDDLLIQKEKNGAESIMIAPRE